ncbi:MAG: hypothetical protein KatS3mg022_2478 [Armatimonadota bacterium]|nr:MAG: hypothetical protein KatS3mg022_0820 [Armatimonadota bacterium]GIV17043.1 MAG: hypothetical protein KatS3mg022_2478 [Armatimonadota bacterium]
MREFLLYTTIGLAMILSQTWWYPKHIGWARTLAIWLVGALVVAAFASITRLLSFHHERYRDWLAILVVAILAAAVIGLTRGLWVVPKP